MFHANFGINRLNRLAATAACIKHKHYANFTKKCDLFLEYIFISCTYPHIWLADVLQES